MEAIEFIEKFQQLHKLDYPQKGIRLVSGLIWRIIYFLKAINFGIKSNGSLELSRTYFELGKFLSDPTSKQKQLNGLTANDYLEKAKTMFEEMGLEWDLEEYGKYIKSK